jgi:hypothetical protein
MPNFDGGHYFLTVLAPIKTDASVGDDGRQHSHLELLRQTLETLPTAHQDGASAKSKLNSPFARHSRTHLARFVVIDDVVYNGRNPCDPIWMRLTGKDPINPQPVDRLKCPYLMFAADIDTASGDDGALKAYLTELWSIMEAELREVFRHCVGFDGVAGAEAFCAYIMRCQIETTMPFNDYWTDLSALLSGPTPWRAFAPAIAAAAAAVVTVLALLLQILGIGGWSWGLIALAGAVVTAVLLYVAYRVVIREGEKPFPMAPDSDLKSILKALYLQQKFVDFAAETQGADAKTLHRKFGAFLKRHKPGDLDAPSQAPGVIRS